MSSQVFKWETAEEALARKQEREAEQARRDLEQWRRNQERQYVEDCKRRAKELHDAEQEKRNG